MHSQTKNDCSNLNTHSYFKPQPTQPQPREELLQLQIIFINFEILCLEYYPFSRITLYLTVFSYFLKCYENQSKNTYLDWFCEFRSFYLNQIVVPFLSKKSNGEFFYTGKPEFRKKQNIFTCILQINVAVSLPYR